MRVLDGEQILMRIFLGEGDRFGSREAALIRLIMQLRNEVAQLRREVRELQGQRRTERDYRERDEHLRDRIERERDRLGRSRRSARPARTGNENSLRGHQDRTGRPGADLGDGAWQARDYR